MIIGHDLEVYGEKIKGYFAKFGIVDLSKQIFSPRQVSVLRVEIRQSP